MVKGIAVKMMLVAKVVFNLTDALRHAVEKNSSNPGSNVKRDLIGLLRVS